MCGVKSKFKYYKPNSLNSEINAGNSFLRVNLKIVFVSWGEHQTSKEIIYFR
jgi:hypothetical protein